MIHKNNQKKAVADRYKSKREALRKIMKDPEAGLEEKMEAQRAFARLPRRSMEVRVINRCAITGRPRGVLRKFGLSRIAFRDMASRGLIPGVVKSSW
jgi:small subunit ribosomal protein S14